MNLKDPVGENIHFWDDERTIVDVGDEILIESPFKQVSPMILFQQAWVNNVTIRLDKTDDLQASIKRVEGVFRKHNPLIRLSIHL